MPKHCLLEAGLKAAAAPAVNIEASATEGRKKARGVQPGSFLSLMIDSKHQDGRGVSDDEATSQAFTFLLAGYETTVMTPLFPVVEKWRATNVIHTLRSSVFASTCAWNAVLS